jgi:hypothetical protein
MAQALCNDKGESVVREELAMEDKAGDLAHDRGTLITTTNRRFCS